MSPNCCPHCSADIKPMGQNGLCWHCHRPMPSEIVPPPSVLSTLPKPALTEWQVEGRFVGWLLGAYILALILGIALWKDVNLESISYPLSLAGIMLGYAANKYEKKEIAFIAALFLQPITIAMLVACDMLRHPKLGSGAAFYFFMPIMTIASGGKAFNFNFVMTIYGGGVGLSVIGWLVGYNLTRERIETNKP